MTKKQVTESILEALKNAKLYREEFIKLHNLPAKHNSHFFSDITEATIEPFKELIRKQEMTAEEAVVALIGGAAMIQQVHVDKVRKIKG